MPLHFINIFKNLKPLIWVVFRFGDTQISTQIVCLAPLTLSNGSFETEGKENVWATDISPDAHTTASVSVPA